MEDRAKGRLLSLDAFRGFDMLWIMGLGAVEGSTVYRGLIEKLCVLFGFGTDCWLSRQMYHVPWEGFQFMDSIFCTFIFIAGIAWPYSLAKQREKGLGEGRIALRVLKRGLVLFALGLVYGGFLKTMDFGRFRLFSVLGRIGFAWMFAAWIYMKTEMKTRLAVSAAVLLGYGLLCRFVGAPDFPGADVFSAEGNVVCWLDRTLFAGHTLKPLYDPAGFASLPPAVVTALLGMTAGDLVRSGGRITARLAAFAAALGALGWAATGLTPVIKAIWSPSFALLVGAYSAGAFAFFHWMIDVKGRSAWSFPLRVIGMNAITIYLTMQLVGLMPLTHALFGGVAAHLSPAAGEAVIAAGHLAVAWTFLYVLYRGRIFLKV